MGFFSHKYYDKTKTENELLEHYRDAPEFDFSIHISGPVSQFLKRLVGHFLGLIVWLSAKTGKVSFWFLPFKILTGANDVKAAFENNNVFRVPFGPDMKGIAGPVTFALGLDDDEHKCQRKILHDYMTLYPSTLNEEVQANVAGASGELLEEAALISKAILSNSEGHIDVISEYMASVISATCLKKFGIICRDPIEFAQWNIVVSIQIFANPMGIKKKRRELELRHLAAAARKIRNSIMASIHAEKRPTADTLIGYLLRLRDENAEVCDGVFAGDYLDDDRIVAMVSGMASGFVPTTTLAAGNLLKELCKNPSWYESLCEAARAEDRNAVSAIIMEAARFSPAGNPGHFRLVNEDFQFDRERGATRHKFRKGDLVLLSTPMAMRDSKARECPHEFRPGEVSEPNFMFGHEHHACLGKDFSTELMTELFLALFLREELLKGPSPFKNVKNAGPFLWNFPMTFKPDQPVPQSMVTVAVPINSKENQALVRELLATEPFANPVPENALLDERMAEAKRTEVAEAFHQTGLVHNASLFVGELSKKGEPAPHLLIELNIDGDPQAVFHGLQKQDCEPLVELFKLCGKRSETPLSDFLTPFIADLRHRPYGNIGLNFNGISEFSVTQIEDEQRLTEMVEPLVQALVAHHYSQRENLAVQALDVVRSLMCGEETHKPFLEQVLKDGLYPKGSAFEGMSLDEAIAEFVRLRPLMHLPAGRGPALSAYDKKSFVSATIDYLKTRTALFWATSFFWIPAVFAAMIACSSWTFGFFERFSVFTIAFASFFVAIGLLAILVLVVLVFRLRRLEKTDWVDTSLTPSSQVRLIEERENYTNFVQSQMIAVNKLKPGRFRLLALSVGLWVIYQQVVHWFRPGFVTDIGSIRHAKWYRVSGTDQLIFQANFDGSWEAYLEDFSNKAFPGQNSVWSHCEGFPETKFMTLEGARNADQFKRWVRGKQVSTPFWYSRFPKLSNTQIRKNSMIRDGIAQASSLSEARAWYSYFGSNPKLGSYLESDEIQSMVFNAGKALPYSTVIGVRFEDETSLFERKSLISNLLGAASNSNQTQAKPLSTTIGFGDRKHSKAVFYVALSSGGLANLGLTNETQSQEIESFSSAFITGMANRNRILNDTHQHTPEAWSWCDHYEDEAEGGNKPLPTDLMLFVSAETNKGLNSLLGELESQWKICAIETVRFATGHTGRKNTKTGDEFVVRPLGFRDGISQPVLKGSYRHSLPAPAHDVLEPGEIILGYKDNRGEYPPTPQIDSSKDPLGFLSDMPKALPEEYAKFGTDSEGFRDLGRNGTYLVVRQIELDEAEMFAHLDEKVAEMNAATGMNYSRDHLMGKMIGRWPSGAPLVRYPHEDPVTQKMAKTPAKVTDLHDPRTANDFLFGTEDPQGIKCPLGSHIRRSNPRDSLGDDTKTQIEINNRHRILRRGRNYNKVVLNGDKDKSQKSDIGLTQPRDYDSEGLLFVGLNANIERQFEFIQQTWIHGRSFHGLSDHADPLLGSGQQNSFNVPTESGSLAFNNLQTYTRTRGGGYFFLPSRSFLHYLAKTQVNH